MKKSLWYVLLIFFLLAAADYFFIASQDFIHDLALDFAPSSRAQSGFEGGLPSLNFNFFTPNHRGVDYITQGYGSTAFAAENGNEYPGDWHDGIDLAANYGEPIYAPTGGTVIATGNQDDFCYHRAFGKYIAMRETTGNYVLWFAHLGDINVAPGETITSGERIGTIGDTGFETGPNLHFSIFEAATFTMSPRYNCGPEPTGQDENPIPYIQKLNS